MNLEKQIWHQVKTRHKKILITLVNTAHPWLLKTLIKEIMTLRQTCFICAKIQILTVF